MVTGDQTSEPTAPLARALAGAPSRPRLDRDTLRGTLDRLHAAQAEVYAGGSDAGVRAMLCSHIRWHVPGHSPIAGTYSGIDDVVAYMRRRGELAGGTFRMHPGDLLVGDVWAGRLTDGTARISGREHRWSTIGLYRLHGDRICEALLVPLDQDAFDAVWSSPTN